MNNLANFQQSNINEINSKKYENPKGKFSFGTLFAKEESGIAFIWVIAIFTVLVIVGTSVYQIMIQDTAETAKLKGDLVLRQLALSGIDIGKAALSSYDPRQASPKITLAASIAKESVGYYLEDTYTISGVGKIKITLRHEKIDGKKWVAIISKAQTDGYNYAIEAKMLINPNNEKVFKYLGDYVAEKD